MINLETITLEQVLLIAIIAAFACVALFILSPLLILIAVASGTVLVGALLLFIVAPIAWISNHFTEWVDKYRDRHSPDLNKAKDPC